MTDSQRPENPYAAPATEIVDAGGELAPASRVKRLVGALIDSLLLLIVLVPIMIAVYGGLEAYGQRADEGGFVFEITVGLISFVMYVLVNGYLLARRGQSLGKIAMGTQIVRRDGSKADFVRLVFIRYLPISIVYVIPFAGYLIMIINALLIFRESHCCGHDDLADTMVINAGK